MLLNTKFKKQQALLSAVYKGIVKNKADEIGRAHFVKSLECKTNLPTEFDAIGNHRRFETGCINSASRYKG